MGPWEAWTCVDEWESQTWKQEAIEAVGRCTRPRDRRGRAAACGTTGRSSLGWRSLTSCGLGRMVRKVESGVSLKVDWIGLGWPGWGLSQQWKRKPNSRVDRQLGHDKTARQQQYHARYSNTETNGYTPGQEEKTTRKEKGTTSTTETVWIRLYREEMGKLDEKGPNEMLQALELDCHCSPGVQQSKPNAPHPCVPRWVPGFLGSWVPPGLSVLATSGMNRQV